MKNKKLFEHVSQELRNKYYKKLTEECKGACLKILHYFNSCCPRVAKDKENDTHYIRNAIYLFCGVNRGYFIYPLLYNQEDYEKFNKLYQTIEDEFNRYPEKIVKSWVKPTPPEASRKLLPWQGCLHHVTPILYIQEDYGKIQQNLCQRKSIPK